MDYQNKCTLTQNMEIVNTVSLHIGIRILISITTLLGKKYINITIIDIFVIINKLVLHNSSGPDGISPLLFKKSNFPFSYLLKIVFNKSLRKGSLISVLKSAFVTP